MKYNRKISTILFIYLFLIITGTSQSQAAEYKWLKTIKHEKIFVYTDFEECDFMAKELDQTIRVVLLRSKIKPTVSNSMVFQSTDKGGKSIRELLNEELIDNQKIFIHIYGKCIEYGSAYIYQFAIHFARFDSRYKNALLFSSPEYNVLGTDKFYGIKKAFKKIMEDATEDYLSANKDIASK